MVGSEERVVSECCRGNPEWNRRMSDLNIEGAWLVRYERRWDEWVRQDSVGGVSWVDIESRVEYRIEVRWWVRMCLWDLMDSGDSCCFLESLKYFVKVRDFRS